MFNAITSTMDPSHYASSLSVHHCCTGINMLRLKKSSQEHFDSDEDNDDNYAKQLARLSVTNTNNILIQIKMTI